MWCEESGGSGVIQIGAGGHIRIINSDAPAAVFWFPQEGREGSSVVDLWQNQSTRPAREISATVWWLAISAYSSNGTLLVGVNILPTRL